MSHLITLGLLCLLCFQVLSTDPQTEQLPAHYYSLIREWTSEDNSLHYLAEYRGKYTSLGSSQIINNIEMIVSFHDTTTFRVKIIAYNETRWEIPESPPYPHFTSQDLIPASESCCSVQVIREPFFSFIITRKDTNETLFDTKDKEFIFSSLYIKLSTTLPSEYVYGFGERSYKFKLSPSVYTIWGRDDPMVVESGEVGGNTYSQHPVGLFRDKTGNFFLSLMRNSNAMDIVIDSEPSLTYNMVGGVIDLIFFVGTEYPDSVIKAYHKYLGNFTMMPFWSMGYHQSKWGYSSYAIMQDVVNGYIDYDIPLDAIWSDIDYLQDYEIFTVKTNIFPPHKMREFTTQYKKKWIPIIDAGIKCENPRGPAAKEGLARGIFLKNKMGKLLVGNVWPGKVYFPDFFNPDTENYWSDMLQVLYDIIPFAGIWLDMNEPANFVYGEEGRWWENPYSNLPYLTDQYDLQRKTVSLDAVHYGNIDEFNVHPLFALLQNAATHKFLKTKSKLPFILARSTTMGVGRFSAHWTGDNGAYWFFLQNSIPGNFNFQIFGIPFVGSDICGFMDGTNEELCARWVQLGALYPFARNHHEEKTRSQEPWQFDGSNEGVSLIETTKIALKTRYSILKWYYSLFIEAGGAGSVFRPLMFEFPGELTLYEDGYTDWEFLLGKGVLCTPKVESGEAYVNAYFPKAVWYNLFTGKKEMGRDDDNRVKRVETPYNASVPMFLREGYIVHRQRVEKVLSTEDLDNEFELIVGLEEDRERGMLKAKGGIMGIGSFDDSSVYDRCVQDACMYDVNVRVVMKNPVSCTVEIEFTRQKEEVKKELDSVGVYGVRLYGLPIEFMDEDETRHGYAITQILRKGEGKEIEGMGMELMKVVEVEDRAFGIEFDDVLIIRDGDVIKMEILI